MPPKPDQFYTTTTRQINEKLGRRHSSVERYETKPQSAKTKIARNETLILETPVQSMEQPTPAVNESYVLQRTATGIVLESLSKLGALNPGKNAGTPLNMDNLIQQMQQTKEVVSDFLEKLDEQKIEIDDVETLKLLELSVKMDDAIKTLNSNTAHDAANKPVINESQNEQIMTRSSTQLATQGSFPHDPDELNPSYYEMLDLLGLAFTCSQIPQERLNELYDQYLARTNKDYEPMQATSSM